MIQLQQELQQSKQQLQQMQLALQNKQDKHLVDIHKITIANQTKLEDRKIHEAHEDQRNAVTHLRALTEQQAKQRHELTMHHLNIGGKNKMLMGDEAWVLT